MAKLYLPHTYGKYECYFYPINKNGDSYKNNILFKHEWKNLGNITDRPLEPPEWTEVFKYDGNGIEKIGKVQSSELFETGEYNYSAIECIKNDYILYGSEFKPLYVFCAGCAITLIGYIIWKIMLEKIIGK